MKRKKTLRLTILILCTLGMFFVSTCKKTPIETQKTQEPPKPVKSVLRSSLAGRWYSDNTQILNEQITEFFKKAEVKPKENIIALILPHAGYAYSGQTAAFGLKTITKEYKRIVVIGPSHRVRMENVLSVPRVTHYQTPLGQIPLDVEFINELLEYPLFQNVPNAHKSEHSVQIELPLLQHSQKDFKLVPIVAGNCSLGTINKAAKILKNLVDSKTLVIASSDFVHFGPNYGFIPFKENIPEKIKELDNKKDISLEMARLYFVKLLQDFMSRKKMFDKISVVFDSKEDALGVRKDLYGTIEIVFATKDKDADSVIVEILRNASAKDRISVASDDNFVRNHVRVYGKDIVPIAKLREIIMLKKKNHRSKIEEKGVTDKKINQINEELKKHWGLD